MASFVLSFFPLDVLDGVWDLIESVSEGFLTYSLNHLPDVISLDTFLVLFDMESLYSNIPHDLRLEAIIFWLEQYPEYLYRRFS